MAEVKREKLIEDIYKWVAGEDSVIPANKEILLKKMIEATLDFLYTNGYLDTEKGGKGNGKK